VITFLILPLTVCPSLAAFDKKDFDYDIFRRDTALTIWMDLSFYLSKINQKKLTEGIDLALEYQLTLAVPKRFWGSNTVSRRTGIVKISYHRITEDYLLTSTENQPECDRRFIAKDKLLQFLSDSVFIALAPFDSLDRQKKHTLEIKLTGITLTALNLLSENDNTEDSQTPLKSLFKQFLNLTGYGRKEFTVNSRPFSLDEIYPEP